MAYVSRNIKDRIAIGDNYFIIKDSNGTNSRRCIIEPSPEEVIEGGTDINKALLQLIEDRVVFLMNRFVDDITSNPFSFTLDTLDGIDAEGVWNNGKIGC